MNTSPNEQSLIKFLLQNRQNKILLYVAAAAIIIQFTIFKYFYPFINFLNEYSFQQLEEASSNINNNMTPIGYPRFLRLISIFTYSDTILAAVQYLCIQASALFFIFTLFYFCKPGKLLQSILFVFVVFNPLFLYLANLLTRDSLFASLSMVWFSLLLWIVHRPSNKIMILYLLISFLAFNFRYHAIIYPIIGCFAFGISTMPLRKKLIGGILGLVIIGWPICYQGFQYKKITGRWQPAPNIGWIVANNTIYMYKHIKPAERKPVSIQYNELDKKIRRYLNSTTNIMFYPWELNEAGNVYLWHPPSPLYTYADAIFKKANDTLANKLKRWVVMAPEYEAYGIYLIRKYPLKYLTNYTAYNLKNYFIPPLEYLDRYSGGKTEIPDNVKNWFKLKSNKITTRVDNSINVILNFYSILNGIATIIMLLGLLYYWLLKELRYNNEHKKNIQLAAFAVLTNALFTIILTNSFLRLQAFPILLSTTFALLLVDWMLQLMKNRISADKESEISSRIAPEIT
jgi:hypothetical protein